MWAAIRATVLDVPLLVAEHADTAVGACILAAAGTLHRDLSTAAQAMVADGREIAPADDGQRDALDESFARFAEALSERGWIDEDLRRAALDSR